MNLRAHNAGARGFTLVELMIVVIIVAVMTGLMVGELRGSFEDALLRSTARKVIDLCDTASNRAISVHQPYTLRFNSVDGKFLLRPKAENPESVGITVDSEMNVEGELDTRIAMQIREPGVEEENDPGEIGEIAAERERRASADVLTFYPDGTAEAREISLQDRTGVELILRLSPITGRVRVVDSEAQ